MIITCLWVNIYSQTNKDIQFTKSEIEYIYNRTLDVSLKNNGNGNPVHSLFNVHASEFYQDAHFFINKNINKDAFWPLRVSPKDSNSFKQITYFKTIDSFNIICLDSFIFSDLETINSYSDINIICISFSNIYSFKDKYYLGILVGYKRKGKSSIFNIGSDIVQFEYCMGRFILFRKLLLYFGMNLFGYGMHGIKIDDVECK